VRPTGTGGPTTTPATPPPTVSKTPTPTPTPTSNVINLNPADYIGKSYKDAAAALQALGFGIDQQSSTLVASSPTQNGTVSNINPYGNQTPDKTITIYVYQNYVGPPAPTAAPTFSSGAHSSGDTVAIGWTAYGNCPSGFSLSGYNVTLTNATFAPGSSSPFGASAPNSANIVLGTAGTDATINYTITCGTGSGALTSGPSPTASFSVN
jgi:serine/threonine-protein kinase